MIKTLRASLVRINASSTVMICTVLPRPGSSPSSPPPSATALNSHRTPSTWSGRRTCEGEVGRQMSRPKRARPEKARSNALVRVHDRREGRGSGEALATRGGRRMHGEDGRTPSTGAGRCWPAYSSPRALDKPPHLPRRHAWECSRARRRRRLPPEARRSALRARATRGERAEFLPAAHAPRRRHQAPRHRPQRLQELCAETRSPPPLAPRLPWVCVYHSRIEVQEIYFSGNCCERRQGHATALEIERGCVVTLPVKASVRFLALAACQHHYVGHAGQTW